MTKNSLERPTRFRPGRFYRLSGDLGHVPAGIYQLTSDLGNQLVLTVDTDREIAFVMRNFDRKSLCEVPYAHGRRFRVPLREFARHLEKGPSRRGGILGAQGSSEF